ncbi:MAG: protein-arginine deiminase family protein [Actinomycetaceae bacterium]|nr:protein-arginine deiminase family protein [Actinomycetaceae bacterium]MDU0970516.1 protein-arginine deiminase family protein [Actinomycetaceae bacterium]
MFPSGLHAGAVPDNCVPTLASTGATIAAACVTAALCLVAGAIFLTTSRKRHHAAGIATALVLGLGLVLLPHAAPQAQAAEGCPPGYHLAAGHHTKAHPGSSKTAAQPTKPTPSPSETPTETTQPAAPAPVGTDDARFVADTNRDGVANPTDGSDTEKAAATVRSGAVFLANIDDSSKRCPLTKDKVPLKLDELKKCSDAADEVVNGPEDAKDLAPLASSPLPKLRDSASATLSVDKASATKVHVFAKRGDEWTLVTPTTQFSAADLKAGLTLGLEGTDVVRDGSWDGSVAVTLTITDGKARKALTATLREAPLVTQNHTETIQTLLTPTGKASHFEQTMVDELGKLGKANGTEVKPFTPSSDVWTQDSFEPMYQSMPTADGPRTMRVLLRTDQMRGVDYDHFDSEEDFQDVHPKPIDPYYETKVVNPKNGHITLITVRDQVNLYQAMYGLRGPGVGVLSLGTNPKSFTLDSGGNIESLPPMPGYPAGRVLMGHRTKENIPSDEEENEPLEPSATIRGFFESQGVQKPIYLDTSFLSVGHIDEFLSTVPANNKLGWKLVVASPKMGVDLVKKLEAAGHGDEPLVSNPGGAHNLISYGASQEIVDLNLNAERIIDENIATLKRETPITDADIIRVPVLWYFMYDDDAPGGVDQTKTHLYAQDLLPNAVNGVPMKKNEFIAPKQWGPMIDGHDVFADAVTKAYKDAGVTVKFVNTYNVLYVHGGEVHCGTNALRETVPYFLQP